MLGNKLSAFLLSNLNESLITDDGITLVQLKDDVAKARGSIKTINSKKIALFHSDAYIFLVWLLAAMQEKKKLFVPVEKSITFNSVLDEWFKLGEFDKPDMITWGDEIYGDGNLFNIVDVDFEAVGVYTSGSTGIPVQIAKQVWQLENEVDALELTFGERIPKDVVFNRSVSHQHFFGMPFGLLWPLYRGSRISRSSIRGPHEWDSITPQVLITSPSFLKTVEQTSSLHKDIGPGIESIFCAGGLLDNSTILKITEVARTRVVNIYGSSETGHIAWKSSPDMSWQLQNGVVFKKPIESILEVRSKFCPNEDWFPTSDLAKEFGDSFEILGRADRIIKIEGTRISLDQLIAAINSSEFVENSLVNDFGNGRRSQLGAILKLSRQGVELVEEKGKLYLVNAIKNSLKGKVSSISVPRRWRFVEDFPKNSLGKVVKVEIDALFSEALKTPIVISSDFKEHSLELLLDITKTLECFKGHFKGFPVIPGVALIEWAIRYAQGQLTENFIFSGMSQIKFLKLIKPNQVVRLKLNFDSSTLNLKFQYSNLNNIFSSGILKFSKVV